MKRGKMDKLAAVHEVERKVFLFLEQWEVWRRQKQVAKDAKNDEEFREIEKALPELPRELAIDLGTGDAISHIKDAFESGYFAKDKVVLLKEKHGDSMFLLPAGDQEAHGRLALSVIKDRLDWMEADTDAPTEPGTSLEQAQNLEPKLAKIVEDDWRQYKHDLERHKEDSYLRGLTAKAKAGDAVAAVKLMKIRRGYEYEGFEVEVPKIP
jgi:hypothetical protein